MTERQGIEIEYCPQCRGVWLDRGELDKIIERSSSRTTEKEYEIKHKDNLYYKKKKRKSFWESLVDFE